MLDLAELGARAQALVAKAEAAKAATAEIASAKSRIQIARLSRTESRAVLARIQDLELTRDYTPAALVLRTQTLVCTCGARSYGPAQLFVLQQHQRHPGTRRYVGVPTGPWPDLPRRSEGTEAPVEVCAACAHAHGFIRSQTPGAQP